MRVGGNDMNDSGIPIFSEAIGLDLSKSVSPLPYDLSRIHNMPHRTRHRIWRMTRRKLFKLWKSGADVTEKDYNLSALVAHLYLVYGDEITRSEVSPTLD